MVRYKKTGTDKIDFDPIAQLTTGDYDALAIRCKKPKISYVAGNPRVQESRVRVNIKIQPTTSRIDYPPEMKNMKKLRNQARRVLVHCVGPESDLRTILAPFFCV